MPPKLDLIGHVFDNLTVMAEAPRQKNVRAYSCKCVCGSSCVVISPSLRSGNTRSCGCLTRAKTPLAVRYERHVIRHVDPDACWGWSGTSNEIGYGRLRTNKSKDNVYAHRVSWLIHNGPIPDDQCVLHSCDNPPCSNPRHLFLGTRTDNHLDMMRKGRGQATWKFAIKARVEKQLAKTHCKNGHEYAGSNLSYVGTARRCKTCMRNYMTAHRKRKEHAG